VRHLPSPGVRLYTYANFTLLKGEEMATQKEKRDLEIPEGEGRFPWWIWIAVVAWLVYAFLIGPFALTSPR
jgi:hypothetical protein